MIGKNLKMVGKTGRFCSPVVAVGENNYKSNRSPGGTVLPGNLWTPEELVDRPVYGGFLTGRTPDHLFDQRHGEGSYAFVCLETGKIDTAA